jgi:hypothetical protein
VLPESAGKLNALRFLMRRENFSLRDTVFAGDSGNDLDVLLSDIPAVLVANADPEIKAHLSQRKRAALYIAEGDFLGMNGNYSAGILEGVAHFWPEANAWLHELKGYEDPMYEQASHALLNEILAGLKPEIGKFRLRHFYTRLGANFYAITPCLPCSTGTVPISRSKWFAWWRHLPCATWNGLLPCESRIWRVK